MKKLLLAYLLLVARSVVGATWDSNGCPTETDTTCRPTPNQLSIQYLHDNRASDGDTITMPAGTFHWLEGPVITKGITLSGHTAISNPGTSNCTADDQTIVIDDKTHSGAGKILKAELVPGKHFRLTGITFRGGTSTIYGGDGGITINSSGGLVDSARVDNCHFDHLYWNAALQILGWVFGVQDHCLVESNSQGFSALIFHNNWNNQSDNASWADYPYFGSGKFWFFETSTYVATGNDISGTFDSFRGGRWVVRHCYLIGACAPGGHGTEAGGVRGERCQQIYNNTFNWTRPFGGHSHRSGSVIWHDNTWLGVNSNNGAHTNLPYFRQLGAIGNDLTKWGLADGANGWDSNDAHGVYFSGIAIGTQRNGFVTSTTPMTPNALAGMQVRNDNPSAQCYLHSAYISSNTTDTISYYYYGAGDRGFPLIFNAGDAFSVRKVLIALDQAGRGKGDLISSTVTPDQRHWPNQNQEPCFSWNNKNTDTGQVLGFNSDIPTQHLGSDYINLGAGLPVDAIPTLVQSAYSSDINGGTAYTQEFVYPHPLVSGSSPTPTATATATSTGTPSPTPTFTPTATATFTPTPTPAGTPSPTPTATVGPPCNFDQVILSTQPSNLKGYWKCNETSGTTLADSSGNSKNLDITGAINTNYWLGENGEQGTCFRTDGAVGFASRTDSVIPSIDNVNFTLFALFKGGSDFNAGEALALANTINEKTYVTMGQDKARDPRQAAAKARGNAITDFGPPITGGVAFDNNWHSITWRRNGTSFSLFVDGLLVNSRTATLTTGGSLTRTSLMHTLHPGFPPSTFAKGSVQHAAIWNTALSDVEISTIQAARTCGPSPTATATATATSTATATATLPPDVTPSPTPTATSTATATATATETPGVTVTPCPSVSPCPCWMLIMILTPTPTATATATP
jgi:hypothetical protein